MPGEQESRPLRADAVENHDRLLAAAAAAFARDGAKASLKAIAEDAGVGIGTLYRRFPSREFLVEAIYRNESARLCASGAELLQAMSPLAALEMWMDQFLEYLSMKQGMAQALKTVLTADDDLRLQTRGMLIDVMSTLLSAAERDETVRPGLDPTDVVLALGGIALIAGDQGAVGLARRLVDLLLAGLTNPSWRPRDL